MPDETFATDATNGEDQEPEVIESPVDEPEDKIEPEAKPESEGDSDTKKPVETEDSAESSRVRELEELVEGLKKSTRAIASERNTLRAQVRELQPPPAADEPAEEAAPIVDADVTALPFHIKKISPLVEPLLGNRLYDTEDDTVYIGDPAGKTAEEIQKDYPNWVSPDVARSVVNAKHYQHQQEEIARQVAAQQEQENLSQIGGQFDNTISAVREKMFPMFSDDEGKADVELILSSMTASELARQGFTLDGFGRLDEKHLDAVPEALKAAVNRFRNVLVKHSRMGQEASALAADNAPVAGRGARAGSPPTKKLHELSYDDQIDAMTARAEALLREQHGKL